MSLSVEFHRACTGVGMVMIAVWVVVVAGAAIAPVVMWTMARLGLRDRRRAAAGGGKPFREHVRDVEAWRQEAETGHLLYPVPELEVRAVRYEKKRVPLTLVGESGTHDHLINGGRDGRPAA